LNLASRQRFSGKASTANPTVNAIELSAGRTDCTSEPSQVQTAITRSASISQARQKDRRPQRDDAADGGQCQQKETREQADALDRCAVRARSASQLSLCG